MTKKVRWGIIGTGRIARTFAHGLAESQTGQLIASGSRSADAAERFAKDFPIAAHGSYEDLLADQNVEAVYISTPHPMHAEWAIKSAEAGKHVLCEKPLTMNHAEAMAVIEAARANDVFLMEAFMYRCHPQTARLLELIREGAIGEVRLIQATFSFLAGWNLQSRLLSNQLGGGGILDVGCYCTSMARLLAGVVSGEPFLDPTEVKGVGQIGGESRVDETAIASLKFPNGVLAHLTTGVRLSLDNFVRVWGEDGNILVPSPWVIGREPGAAKIIVTREGRAEEIVIHETRNLFSIEADTVAHYISGKQSPVMSWADTLGNMQTLDRWRAEIGLVYDTEKPEAKAGTVTRRPLNARTGHGMKFGEVAGVDKPISRLVMGVDNQSFYPHAAVMFDDFIERGGNCFDIAWVYRSGLCERLFGHWMKNRAVRDQVVILGKGAHTPECTPDGLTRQLHESLERMQTDFVDIYMLHRDNPAVPVGEFVDVLNEHKNAGRIRAFGGSNWTRERLDAANEYARRKGVTGFSAVSNNFSLARMIEPVWPGCLSFSDTESRAWLTKTRMPLFAWASQARGFFTGRVAANKTKDLELARCWFSEENIQRHERAIALAEQKGVLPIHIALAYVLAQPFPTFALIGPRTIDETRTAMPALEVELTPEEFRWLNLEE